MSLREILNQDCQELIQKQEKPLCFIFGSDQSGKVQKNKNRQRLLDKIEISYLLLLDNSREKILCTIDLPVPQCISLSDFTKKIDIFMGNWSRKLNIHKQYNFNLLEHKPLLWNCTKIDSFSSAVNLCLASNLPEISAPELFEHIIGFFKHSILHQSFDFDLWKLTEKLQRNQEKCISIAKCKTLSIDEVKNFENESENKKFTKETDVKNFENESENKKFTKETDVKEESATLKSSLCIKLQNSQLQQNTIFGFSYQKNIETRNKKLLNFRKIHLSSMKRRINPEVFKLAILEKQFTDRKIFLFNCKSLNRYLQLASPPVTIQSQLIINKSNKNIKCLTYGDDDNMYNSDESQSRLIEKFKATSCCHDTEENMIVDTSSVLAKKESVQVEEIEIMDTCNFMSYINNKKHYQITESHFFTDYLHNGKYMNKSRYSNDDSEKRLKSFNANIKPFGFSNIYNKYTPCKESWATLLIKFNVQTIATHIKKLLTMFLYKSESIPYLPTIYNKNIISCSPHQHGFSSEYKTQKSIALGNKAQLSDKSLICVRYASSCSNFKAIMNTRELDTNSRMVTYRSTTQLHKESLHVSALPNENRHIANIPDPPKSDSLKENLITTSLNNLNEGSHSCNDVESKSQSFVSNDNNLSASSCIKIASDQNKNSAQFSAQMKASVSPVGNINCPEYSNPDYNCLINPAQDIHSNSLKRKQSSLCDDNIISTECESESMKDCILSKTTADQDGDKIEEKDKFKMVENEQYNEYKVIKKPRLQLREEGNCFHNDPQYRTCSYEMERDSHDQFVPENDDQLSFPEESTSLYSNNGLLGNEHHGAFCWNSSLIPSYADNMKDSLKECPVVLPLTTCNKPLRVGLSKRQKLPPLHPQAKKRSKNKNFKNGYLQDRRSREKNNIVRLIAKRIFY